MSKSERIRRDLYIRVIRSLEPEAATTAELRRLTTYQLSVLVSALAAG